MIESVTVGTAFLAGFLSFFAPCVVILVPVFLANLAGVKLENADVPEQQRLLHRATWLFVIGFTITFTVFGAVSGLLGAQFVRFNDYFSVIAGVLLIFFGLVIADVIKVGFLARTFRLNVNPNVKTRNWLYPLLMGIVFAAGWTPCVGPVLAAILLQAGESASAWIGSFYLLIYSVGLMLPFLIVGYFIKSAQKLIYKINPYLGVIKWVTAIIVIALGILLISGDLGRFISFFYFLRPPSM